MIDWLTTQYAPLLARAEDLYGPRSDGAWRFVGVQFDACGPCLGFSETAPEVFGIFLGNAVRKNPSRALYQMAQQVLHSLHPVRGDETTRLENGAAVHFALTEPAFSDAQFPERLLRFILTRADHAAEREALEAFEALLDLRDDALKEMRRAEPDMSRITPDLVRRVVPAVPEDLARSLCALQPIV